MAFRTKLDYSDNRQIKQREQTSTTLSGATVFGLPFSGLTSGVDTTNTGTTEDFVNVTGNTFSGNASTTIFTWSDSRMSLTDSSLSAITPSNSGLTQDSGNIFTANTTTVIDGNTVVLSYSGVSLEGITVDEMVEVSPGNYTGTTSVLFFDILSGDSLDFTGRTIWVDCTEIVRTKKLIITENPTPGYIWTCVDSEGLGYWAPVSGATSSANTYTTGSTLIGTTAYFDRTDTLSAYTLDLSSLVSGSNTFTTGTTVVGTTLYFDRNDTLSAYTADLSSFIDNTNFYVTGGTVIGNTMYLDRNDTLSAATIDVSSLTGGSSDNYTTGSTLVGTTAYFDRTDSLSAYTLDLSSLGAGEVNTASNIGGGTGIFSGKSGTDLQFKTLTSTGGTITITSTGATVNLEAQASSTFPYRSTTVSGSVLTNDWTIDVTTTGDTTQTLPTAVGITGKVYNIKNSDVTNTSTVTLATTGSELIDGTYGNGTDLTFKFPVTISVQSTGAGWIII